MVAVDHKVRCCLVYFVSDGFFVLQDILRGMAPLLAEGAPLVTVRFSASTNCPCRKSPCWDVKQPVCPHKSATYKINSLWGTLRALKRPGRAAWTVRWASAAVKQSVVVVALQAGRAGPSRVCGRVIQTPLSIFQRWSPTKIYKAVPGFVRLHGLRLAGPEVLPWGTM
jgi:hypothetical protein